jgi:hypothetical protein
MVHDFGQVAAHPPVHPEHRQRLLRGEEQGSAERHPGHPPERIRIPWYFGKFQNGYFNLPTDLPLGYDLSAWFVHANKIDPNEPEHTFNEFGTVREYPQPPNYTSHLITDRVEQFLSEQAQRPEPFFLTASYLSPHDPYNPVPEHEHDFDGYPLEMVPSMDAMSATEREQQRVVQEGMNAPLGE